MAAHVTAASLQVLFCKSLELGYVPNDWKLTLVTPLYKGSGSKSVLVSYRPISVTSHVPIIINLTLNIYLSKHSILHDDQFTYVKSQSTVNALHTVVDTVLCNINDSKLTGIVNWTSKRDLIY